jgi:RNA polymerase sigma-70 factor (ECF subfamily)
MREITLTELEGSNVTPGMAEEAFHMDEQTFRGFYERTARPLWSYLSHLSRDVTLAEDLVQEAYYRFLRADLKSADEAYQKNYLFRIATNLVRDHWRRQPHQGRLRASVTEEIRSDDRTAERIHQSSDLGRVLNRLKPRERQILWLAYVEGSSHKEIAEVAGLRAGSIRLLLFRARHKMAGLLRQMEKGVPRKSK